MGVGLTQFGGVALIGQFFQRIGLRGALCTFALLSATIAYSISESLEALLYPLILGLGRIETTEPLRHNGVFPTWLACQGIPMPRVCDVSCSGWVAQGAIPCCDCTTVGGQSCSNGTSGPASIWTVRC
jgi:hypothetical protein